MSRNARDFPTPSSAELYNSKFEKCIHDFVPVADATRFDVTSVLNSDLTLNLDEWEKARPLLLGPLLYAVSQPATEPAEADHVLSAMSYAMSFASLTSILVHVYLWHRDEIKKGRTSPSMVNNLAHLLSSC